LSEIAEAYHRSGATRHRMTAPHARHVEKAQRAKTPCMGFGKSFPSPTFRMTALTTFGGQGLSPSPFFKREQLKNN
jgi:hypothetical protein